MKMQRKNWVRYFAILLSLIFLLQGCVSPKTGQLSIPLPKDISYPSALVIKDKYLGALSMDGKFDPLYKVNGNFSEKESNYFIIENQFFLKPYYSLWKLDMNSNKLICLIPRIQRNKINHFEISSDKKYFIFDRSDIFGVYIEDVFYSLEEQKEIKLPQMEGLSYIKFFETEQPNCFFLVYCDNNKDEKKEVEELYLWDIKNKTCRKIEYPKLEGFRIQAIYQINAQGKYFIHNYYSHQLEQSNEYIDKTSGLLLNLNSYKAELLVTLKGHDWLISQNISEMGKVLYYHEDNNLWQFDLESGKKEKLVETSKRPIIYGFTPSQYLLISFNTNTTTKENDGKDLTFGVTKHDFYLMTPNKNWIQLSQRFRNCEIQDCQLTRDNKLFIALINQEKKSHQLLQWDLEKDTIRVLFETRNKKINFTNIEDFSNQSMEANETSYSAKYIRIGLSDSESSFYGFQHILNMDSLEIREIQKIPNELRFTWIYAFKDSLWCTKSFPTNDSKKETEILYYLDWYHPEKLVPITSSGYIRSSLSDLSSDITYLPVSDTAEGYPNGKIRIVNTRSGKELAFPESKDFQFITWLEEK